MIKFPLTFKVAAQASSGIQSAWSAEAGTHMVAMAIPPEFEGPGDGLSPEDLYALALLNCFIATFKVVAEKSKLSYSDIKANAELTVDRDAQGRPWMAKVDIRVNLTGATDIERTQKLLQKTSESCMILNSTKTEKTFSFEVH